MRKVSQGDARPDEKDQASELLEQTRMLNKSVDLLTTSVNKLGERMLAVETLANAAAQYEKDHDKLHQTIATMAASESKKVQEALKAVMTKLAEIPEVNLEVPVTPNVVVENVPAPEGTKTYKVLRTQNGLIDEVVEKPSG